MSNPTLEEVKAIWEDYQNCKARLRAYEGRMKMIEDFVTEAENQLYYVKIQLQKLKKWDNDE